MALTKLTSNLIEGGTGTDWVTAIQTSNFTAEAVEYRQLNIAFISYF